MPPKDYAKYFYASSDDEFKERHPFGSATLAEKSIS